MQKHLSGCHDEYLATVFLVGAQPHAKHTKSVTQKSKNRIFFNFPRQPTAQICRQVT